MRPEDGGCAFPFVSHGGVHEHQHVDGGMSMRQWYAGLAMQALVTRGAREKLADYIESAYTIADFMLLEDAAFDSRKERAP